MGRAKGPPMTMKKRDASRRLRLLSGWGHACVLCGRGFATIDCVTFEHLVPRSMGGRRRHNIGPSHHVCNSLRGTASLLEGAARVEAALCELAVRWGTGGVERFLATPVPHRLVPERQAKRFAMQARSLRGGSR